MTLETLWQRSWAAIGSRVGSGHPPPVAPMCEEYKNELTEYLTMLIQENQKRKTAKLEELAAALPGPPGRGGMGGGAEGRGPHPELG